MDQGALRKAPSTISDEDAPKVELSDGGRHAHATEQTLEHMKTTPLGKLFGIAAVLLAFVTLTQGQELVSSVPESGAFGVSTGTSVQFTFDVAMEPVQVVQWASAPFSNPASQTPLTGGFSYSWSGDGKTLTATRSGGFPGNSVIYWTLVGTGFFSDDGFPLGGNETGAFITGAGGGGGGSTPTGTVELSLFRFASYDQFSAADPVLATSNIYNFSAYADSTASRQLTNVVLTLPGGQTQPLFTIPFVGTNFFHVVTTNVLANLNALYGPGNYGFSLQAPSSNQTVNLTLPANAFPGAPKLSNYAAAQAVDPAAPFTLTFNAGGVASDFAYISISEPETGNSLFESGDFGSADALKGTSNQLVFAAGTFQPGKTYELMIERWIGASNQVGGVISSVGVGTITRSRLKTSDGSLPAVISLSNPAFTGNAFTLTATVNVTGQSYILERSSDTTNWFNVTTDFFSSTSQVMTDPNPNNPHFLYRVKKQ
jgi:hypothetical protein